MSTTTTYMNMPLTGGRRTAGKLAFREKFQRSLRSCVRRGFSIEEAFGMIWVETWEEVSLSEREQSELYDELINWARRNCS